MKESQLGIKYRPKKLSECSNSKLVEKIMSLDISLGEDAAITGGVGWGKSTLAKLLAKQLANKKIIELPYDLQEIMEILSKDLDGYIIIVDNLNSRNNRAKAEIYRALNRYQKTTFIVVGDFTTRIEREIRVRCMHKIIIPKPILAELEQLAIDVCDKEQVIYSRKAIGELVRHSKYSIGKLLLMIEEIMDEKPTGVIAENVRNYIHTSKY